MTPRDIILANLNHEQSPRPGLTFDRGRTNDMVFAGLGRPPGYSPRRWTEGNREFYDDEWGNLWARMTGGSVKGEILRPAIPDWPRLDSYRPPDYSSPALYEPMRQAFAQPTDKFRLACIGGFVFDSARYLRKLENYLADMALHPDHVERLNRIVAACYEARIHGAGQAGADGIMIGEDLGTQNGLLFSPAMFRRFFKTEYTRLLGIAHDYRMKVFFHSCGYNWALIDDLIDVGIDCFQFDQPARYDMGALAEKLRGRKAALWAPVDIQKVLPTGDRRLIEAETDRMLSTFRGGLIMKNYPDLHGIGVKDEWDQWAYDRILQVCRIT